LRFPIEQHFAEKIHAYTLPRERAFNSRVKDLVDLILLIQENKMKKTALKKAIKETFAKRVTHDVPPFLIAPPKEWQRPFKAMALECNLHMEVEAFELLYDFWKAIKF
jgi:hypothetical protein